jgi:hypothetical protein
MKVRRAVLPPEHLDDDTEEDADRGHRATTAPASTLQVELVDAGILPARASSSGMSDPSTPRRPTHVAVVRAEHGPGVLRTGDPAVLPGAQPATDARSAGSVAGYGSSPTASGTCRSTVRRPARASSVST